MKDQYAPPITDPWAVLLPTYNERENLEPLELGAIRANGYSCLIEMFYHCERLGFTVGETPIIFADRKLGQSKISRGEIAKAGLTVLRLATDRLRGACTWGSIYQTNRRFVRRAYVQANRCQNSRHACRGSSALSRRLTARARIRA